MKHRNDEVDLSIFFIHILPDCVRQSELECVRCAFTSTSQYPNGLCPCWYVREYIYTLCHDNMRFSRIIHEIENS